MGARSKPRPRNLSDQVGRIQGQLRYIDRLLRAAHKFDTRAVAALAQASGTLDQVSAEIIELAAQASLDRAARKAERKGPGA